MESFCVDMKRLLFLVLAACAVKGENNYHDKDVSQNLSEDQERPFDVYWNVPTMQCASKKIPFENLYEKYGLIQNKDDKFLGEKISILYDAGMFPELVLNATTGDYDFKNGGLPQLGNLEVHLTKFKTDLEQSIPDPDYDGIAVIDFHTWRPIFRQLFGTMTVYRNISIEIEKEWLLSSECTENLAKERFEKAARKFMESTILLAKQMRPKAKWGYYGYPQCFNMNYKMKESCDDGVPAENDRISWLFSVSAGLYPSLHSSKDFNSTQLASLIRGRVAESERVKKENVPVLPYFWFRYSDGGFFSKEDLNAALETLYKSSASGFVVWGSSSDVNTVCKCESLKEYLDNTLGPAVAAYTKSNINKVPQIPESTQKQDESTLKTTESTTLKDDKETTTKEQKKQDESTLKTTESTTLKDDKETTTKEQKKQDESTSKTKESTTLKDDKETTTKEQKKQDESTSKTTESTTLKDEKETTKNVPQKPDESTLKTTESTTLKDVKETTTKAQKKQDESTLKTTESTTLKDDKKTTIHAPHTQDESTLKNTESTTLKSDKKTTEHVPHTQDQSTLKTTESTTLKDEKETTKNVPQKPVESTLKTTESTTLKDDKKTTEHVPHTQEESTLKPTESTTLKDDVESTTKVTLLNIIKKLLNGIKNI